MTLSSHPLYASYHVHQASQLSPLEDQELAGLIMWVPGCAIYAIAALTLLGQWISKSGSSAPSELANSSEQIQKAVLARARLISISSPSS